MRTKGRLVADCAKIDRYSAIRLAYRFFGVDASSLDDEDVWRTSEEGRHFKFDDKTGEIKAGFGGRLNGKKIQRAPADKTEIRAAKKQDSEYYKQIAKRRETAMKWSEDRQAEFLFRQGFLTEEDAVKAMEDGTAAEQMARYFDIMEANGDPTPTKPIRKSPDLYTEVQRGEHGGDWTQARKDYIRDWTGMSEADVEKTYKELETWFGGSWYSADTECLDNYIDQDGAYGGEIFRGMHFTEEQYASFMKDVAPGSQIGMNGHNSSWTTNREDAWNFARNGDRQVIITCKKNKTSAPVEHLSNKGESEVLAHSRTRWTVIGVIEGTNRTEITVYEAEERMSAEERDKRKMQMDAASQGARGEGSLENRMNGQNDFLEVVPFSEWAGRSEQRIEDGGPGSWNWGHKGRPGKIGGSGKGGGKQYRGGRSDVLYTGSRKDWLNGLTGERQDEAHDFLVKYREFYSQEDEKDKPVEQLIMENPRTKYGGNKPREQLLAFMAEARGWNEHASRLIDEHWDENDKKVAAALAEKYGKAFLGGSELPDDSDALESWEPDDLAYWQDLKSKALDGPVSGREPSEELQYAAGLKERPQKPSGIPKTPEENAVWFDHLSQDEQSQIHRELMSVGISPYGFAGTDMNDVERRLQLKMLSGSASTLGAHGSIRTTQRYLMLKEKMLGVNATRTLAAGTAESLTDVQNQTVKDLLTIGLGKDENNNSLETVSDIAETGLLSDQSVPDFVKAYYLSMKCKALGGSELKDGRTTLEDIMGDAVREWAQKKLKTGKANGNYAERRAQNVVVIQGDSFSERVNSMRKPEGTYSRQELSDIGEEVLKEYEKAYSELEQAKKDMNAAFDMPDPPENATPEEKQKRHEEWANAYNEAAKNLKREQEEMGKGIATILSRVRKIGVENPAALKDHLPGRSSVRKYVSDAYNDYPTEWIEQSIANGRIKTQKVNRGYCGKDVIAISGEGSSAAETATHELGHRFEQTVPGIVKAEEEFYNERTKGERLQRLRDVTGINYRWDEMTRVDNWINPYMGKDYKGRAYELVSMGFEMAFHEPQKLMQDRQYATFILGLLAVG